jgi:hypothetical protein
MPTLMRQQPFPHRNRIVQPERADLDHRHSDMLVPDDGPLTAPEVSSGLLTRYQARGDTRGTRLRLRRHEKHLTDCDKPRQCAHFSRYRYPDYIRHMRPKVLPAVTFGVSIRSARSA